MAEIVHVTDHGARAFARLLEQFKTVQDWQRLLGVFSPQVQALEDAFWDLRMKRFLDGDGAQLDQLGAILAEPREGFDDEPYLQRLIAKTLVLHSSGGPRDIVRIFKRLLPDNTIRFTASGDASFILDIGLINVDFADIYTRFLHKAKSAGIDGVLVFQVTVDTDAFFTDFGSQLSVLASSGATSLTVYSPEQFVAGYLIAINIGLANCALFTVTTVVGSVLGLSAATATGFPTSTAVSTLAPAGQFGVMSASVGATTVVNFPAGHPFQVNDEVTLEPFISGKEETRPVFGVTPTSITVFPSLGQSHAAGSFAIKRLHQGFGDVSDATTGGKLAGTIV